MITSIFKWGTVASGITDAEKAQTIKQFTAKVAGWGNRYSMKIFHWLVIPKLATRMREALFSRPASVPSIPSATGNDALITVGRVERSICSPLRLPFGGSAFLITRRPR